MKEPLSLGCALIRNEESSNTPVRGNKKGAKRDLGLEPLKAHVRWRLLGNAFTVSL